MSKAYVNPLRELQIELSTVCNALCLGCVRTDQLNFNSSKEFIPPKKYLDVDLLYQRLTELERGVLEKIEFCGNIDEPLLHPEFLTLLKKLAEWDKSLSIAIHTNGSSRNVDYFSELAQILKRFDSPHELRFSIDGLEDTNHIYRQRTNYKKIIQNAEAFIGAGGWATWQFIVFPWNDQQSGEAQELAKGMGFKKFLLRKDRSLDPETLQRIEVSRKLENVKTVQKDRGFTLDKLYESDRFSIDCYFKKFNMMFVSWDGMLWPCCFTANIFYESDLSKIEKFNESFYGPHDREFNSLYKHSIKDILSHSIYQSQLVEGWSRSMCDDKTPKLWRCVEKCCSKLEAKTHLDNVRLQG